MKLIEILCRRYGSAEKGNGKILGIAFSLIYALCLALLILLSLDMSVIARAAGLVIAVSAFIFFGLFRWIRVIYKNPLLVHLSSAVLSYCAAIAPTDEGSLSAGKLILLFFVKSVVIFGTTEVLSGFFMSLSHGETHPEHLKRGLMSGLPLFFIIFMYVPSETYFNNYHELRYIYGDIFPHMLVMVTVPALIFSLLSCAMSDKVFICVTRLFAGLTLAVYCQYMFMNGFIPHVAGENIDWDSLKSSSIINVIIWLVIIAVPFAAGAVIKLIKKKKSSAGERLDFIHEKVCVLIGAFQLLSLIMIAVSAGKEAFSYKSVILSGEEQYTVSSEKNIITFILDAEDQKFFEKVFSDCPEKKEYLKDFTCYTNTCMMYDSTYLSIPQMLSGTSIIPEDMSFSDWYKKIWNDEPAKEFYSRLHENNYTVNVFGSFIFDMDYTDMSECIDNELDVQEDNVFINHQELNRSVDIAAAFRYLPVIFKRTFEPDSSLGNKNVKMIGSCHYYNSDFSEELHLNVSESGKNYFIVNHISGVSGVADFYAETGHILDILNDYFDQLKKLGVYDNADIIITADHGCHSETDNMPVWYIKRAGQTQNETGCCASPMILSDFLATCLDVSGLKQAGDEELFGRSIYDIPEDEQRERLVFQRHDLGGVNYEMKLRNVDKMKKRKAMLGYYFTGTKEDLKAHELKDPPDRILYLENNI